CLPSNLSQACERNSQREQLPSRLKSTGDVFCPYLCPTRICPLRFSASATRLQPEACTSAVSMRHAAPVPKRIPLHHPTARMQSNTAAQSASLRFPHQGLRIGPERNGTLHPYAHETSRDREQNPRVP